MVWKPDLDSSYEEAAKIAHLIVPYTRGTGIDVGSGPRRLFNHFITVDNGKDFGRRKIADICADGSALPMFADHALDFVFSSHFLEHVADYRATLADWWRIIKPGGHLVLYLPHKDLYPNIGQPGANPDHKHDFLPDDILNAMRALAEASSYGFDLLENETRDQGDEYSFFQVYRKRRDREVNTHTVWQRNPDGKKRALVIRYGAYGDMMMMSSILPHLKAQGYHVTVNTTPRGYEVVRHDPHIDEFFIQDTNQVPNDQLGPYWHRFYERYDRIINLSGSVEDALLLHHERNVEYWYPPHIRHKLFNINYLERTHDIADAPHDFRVKFYPTDGERQWAFAQRRSWCWMGRDGDRDLFRPIVLWSLAGSSIHKAWPYVDVAALELLRLTPARLVFVGGPECAPLEESIALRLIGWHDMPDGLEKQALGKASVADLKPRVDERWPKRVSFTSGRWTIRQSLAFAQIADVVIGSETGVLNAVCLEPNHKVIMLSHSSRENLTKHWRNTTVLEPPAGACPQQPCHRLHYAFDFCKRDEATGAAACAAAITPDRVVQAVYEALYAKKEAA